MIVSAKASRFPKRDLARNPCLNKEDMRGIPQGHKNHIKTASADCAFMDSLYAAARTHIEFLRSAGVTAGSLVKGFLFSLVRVHPDDRHTAAGARPGLLRPDGPLRGRLREGLTPMLDLILGGAASAGLLGYLLWALLRPEDL
jgi:K+-transporting ATPase KdpF subunit